MTLSARAIDASRELNTRGLFVIMDIAASKTEVSLMNKTNDEVREVRTVWSEAVNRLYPVQNHGEVPPGASNEVGYYTMPSRETPNRDECCTGTNTEMTSCDFRHWER
jgi:hypothetical protein